MHRMTAAVCLVSLAAGASAQPVVIDIPSLDRWMYPFNANPGGSLDMPTFGSPLLDGFDDMDSQAIIGFETGQVIEAGLDPSAYRIVSMSVTATHAGDIEFPYDGTYDAWTTYLPEENPQFTPDADAGRPALLYAVGYRNGFSLETFEEDSPFGDFPPDDPFDTEGIRNAYAAVFDEAGEVIDASNHIVEGFDALPMATGEAVGLEVGDPVAQNTTFAFDVDLCAAPELRGYIAESLAAGKLNFALASLHGAEVQQPGAFPRWYTKENPLALPPFDRTATLTIEVFVGDLGDFNQDGVKNVLDFVAFQVAFAGHEPLADVNQDCVFNILDFVAFQTVFAG